MYTNVPDTEKWDKNRHIVWYPIHHDLSVNVAYEKEYYHVPTKVQCSATNDPEVISEPIYQHLETIHC